MRGESDGCLCFDAYHVEADDHVRHVRELAEEHGGAEHVEESAAVEGEHEVEVLESSSNGREP